MKTQLTENDARESLNIHVESKGAEIREKYGSDLGWDELNQILNDRSYVRYPCEIKFDAAALQSGEFAYPQQNGTSPDEGFTLYLHPLFANQMKFVPALVLYQLVVVNYGDFASADDAETFGAAAVGLTKDDYYQLLCQLADQLPREQTSCSN